jgi:hypothetical protein
MQTASKILISLGVMFGLFAARAIWMEWGQREFNPDADAAGYALLFLAVCFMLLGVVVRALSKTGASPDEPSDDVAEDVDPGTPICPSCLAPVERLQDFCIECGSPLTSHAEIDPIGRIHSMGYTFAKATSGSASRVVLIGIWCIFAVPVVFLFFAIGVFGLPDEQGLSLILRMVLLLGIVSLYIAIVIKTTRNYYRKKRELDSAPPYDENIGDNP